VDFDSRLEINALEKRVRRLEGIVERFQLNASGPYVLATDYDALRSQIERELVERLKRRVLERTAAPCNIVRGDDYQTGRADEREAWLAALTTTTTHEGGEKSPDEADWRCQFCEEDIFGNPRHCPRCGYTVYDPVAVARSRRETH
jgi:rubrerythrin